MSCDCDNNDKYIKSFGDPESPDGLYKKDSRLAKAYEVALGIRQFEIELYWKRSGSFWLLVGAIAASLGFLVSGKADSASGVLGGRGKEVLCCFLSLAGASISYAWVRVNQGSKFWQSNWESQVCLLEQAVVGPLYKTVFSTNPPKKMYSVSGINIVISWYFVMAFSISTLAFLIGKDYKGIILNFIGLDESYIYLLLKFFVVVINVIWFLVAIEREHNGIGKSKGVFDKDASVSIRELTIKEVYASSVAKDNWKSLIGNLKNEPVKEEKLGIIYKLLKGFGLRSNK